MQGDISAVTLFSPGCLTDPSDGGIIVAISGYWIQNNEPANQATSSLVNHNA
jgi:hypothetical protein